MSFWVGHNNPRFPYARHGYLPDDESIEQVSPPAEVHKIVYHHVTERHATEEREQAAKRTGKQYKGLTIERA